MNTKEQNRKRKESYVKEIRKRFVIERDRYMITNELTKVKDFNIRFGFGERFTNDFTGKTDRAVMIWVLTHMNACDKVLRKESHNEAYPFNWQYVISGDIESPELSEAKERIQKLERDNLILQGKYEEATRKGQANA